LGVPCIVSLKGVERILRVNLPPVEQKGLEKSAAVLQEMIGQLQAAGIL
jgi:malate/lactate dehydrogenase